MNQVSTHRRVQISGANSLIRINFCPGANNIHLEADVLFSPLTLPLGGDYYRIDPQIRWHAQILLRSLYRHESRGRHERVAELLWIYAESLLKKCSSNDDSFFQQYIEMQRWVAFATIHPLEAAHLLAAALKNQIESPNTIFARLSELAAAVELPLSGEPELLAYARNLDALAHKNFAGIADSLGHSIHQSITIGDITLPPLIILLRQNQTKINLPETIHSTENTKSTSDDSQTDTTSQTEPVTSPLTDWSQKTKSRIFVSYAHADNQPVDDSTPGWVSIFIDKVRRVVAQQPGGEAIEFWMDYQLEPQHRVNDELRRRIRDSDVILVVISPSYIASKWCQLELETFIAEVGRGLPDERVFMVELLPTERKDWHAQVRDLTSYSFWKKDLDSPSPMTLGWPLPDVRGDRDYWRGVSTLASRIARRLGELRSEPPPPPAPPETPPTTGPLHIIISTDHDDTPLALDAQALLGDLGVDATLDTPPTNNEPPATYRANFEQQLRSSHGVIIVYGEAPRAWVQSKLADVRKLLALKRKGIWVAVLEGPPEPKALPSLPPRDLMVLNCRQGISKEELSRFVQALRSSQRSIDPTRPA